MECDSEEFDIYVLADFSENPATFISRYTIVLNIEEA